MAFDPTSIPEDLSSLSDKALDSLAQEIGEAIEGRAQSLPEDGRLTDEHDAALTEIEALDEAGSRVAGEISSRDELSDARRARLDAVLGRTVEPPAEEGEPAQGDLPGSDPAPVVEPIPVPTAASTAVPARLPARVGTLAALRQRRPPSSAPRVGNRTGAFMKATGNAIALDPGSPLDNPLAVAKAICDKRHRFGNIPDGVSNDYISVATGYKELGEVVPADAEENFSLLRDLRQNQAALVAAAACCAPFTPLYDFFRLAEPQNPVEESLPAILAPRGGIRFIRGECDLADAVAAIGATACTDVSPATKPCVRVECPVIDEVSVTAISQCMFFNNLQYRVFPEQVENFLEDVGVAFAARKETFYLDCINSKSTSVSSTIPYGAARALFFDFTLAATAYRKRQGMRRDSMLSLLLPDWTLDLIRSDMANDANLGLSMWDVTDAMVIAGLRGRGLDPTWYNDTAAGLGQKFATPQAAGALNKYPTNVVSYLFAPGSFARLDGGTLDVGLVRDSTLNRSNELQLFMEEWLACTFLGCESVKLVSTICPNGAAPALVTPFTCP